MSDAKLEQQVQKGNKALSKLLPPLEEPDIFKKIIRGKKAKKTGGGYLSFSSNTSNKASTKRKDTANSNYRKSDVYRQGSGLSPLNKAIGLAQQYTEVVIKIDKASKGIKTANHLKQAALYICRNGLMDVEDNYGDTISKSDFMTIMDSWAEEMGLPDKKENAKSSAAARRFIMSFPKGSDHQSVMSIARQFGQEFFKENGFDYMFVLHGKSEQTPNEPDHPHVHFLIKSTNDRGLRLNIRKNDLKFMRERIAVLSRDYGIFLNATNRAVRGQSQRAKPIERYYNEKRYEEQSQAQKWAIHRNKQKHVKQHPYQANRDNEVISAYENGKPIEDHEILSKAKQTRVHIMRNAQDAVNSLKNSGEQILTNLGGELVEHFSNLNQVESSQQANLRKIIAAKKRAEKSNEQSHAQKWSIAHKKAQKDSKDRER